MKSLMIKVKETIKINTNFSIEWFQRHLSVGFFKFTFFWILCSDFFMIWLWFIPNWISDTSFFSFYITEVKQLAVFTFKTFSSSVWFWTKLQIDFCLFFIISLKSSYSIMRFFSLYFFALSIFSLIDCFLSDIFYVFTSLMYTRVFPFNLSIEFYFFTSGLYRGRFFILFECLNCLSFSWDL